MLIAYLTKAEHQNADVSCDRKWNKLILCHSTKVFQIEQLWMHMALG